MWLGGVRLFQVRGCSPSVGQLVGWDLGGGIHIFRIERYPETLLGVEFIYFRGCEMV